ncbi:MAG: hypothetical protein IIA49_08985, partial [Bacteroidetes bacterium]|nr:hypothetical protein [Bacteroidota bacterium]
MAQHYGFEFMGPIRGIQSLNIDTSNRSDLQKERYTNPTYKTSIHALYLDRSDGQESPIAISATHDSVKKSGGG